MQVVVPELAPGLERLVEEFSGRYAAARNYAPQTRAQYVSDVRYFLLFAQKQGVKRVGKVERRHIEAFLADLDEQGYAAVSRRRKLSAIKAFFDWLSQNKLILGNPAAKVLPPRYDFKLPRVLTRAEYQRLLSVIDDARDRAIVELILQTGLRLSEAHRLSLQDIEIPEPITEETLGLAWIRGRDKDQETVYLNAKACRAVDAWLVERPLVATDALFVSRNEERLCRRQMQRLVRKYVDEAGLDWATVKALRHSFATHHLIKGTPLKQIKDYLGHKYIRSTETLYAEVAKSLGARYVQENGL